MPPKISVNLVKVKSWMPWLQRVYPMLFGEADSFPVKIDCLAVAFIDNEPVGWGSYQENECDSAVFLNSCGVLPAARGRGIQRMLVRKRVNKARNMGFAWAYTYTHANNVHSSNNLIGCGFRMWRPPYWGGRIHPEIGKPWLYWCRETGV